MTRPPRAERVAANRAAIAAKLGDQGFTVRVPEPRPRGRTAGRLEYVEVGQCRTCKFTWRTNLVGELCKHGPSGKPCRGSNRLPLRHAVVLKDLYEPGEKWPKTWT